MASRGNPNETKVYFAQGVVKDTKAPTMMKGRSNNKGRYMQIVAEAIADAEHHFAQHNSWPDEWYTINWFASSSAAGDLSRSLNYANRNEDPRKISRHALPETHLFVSGVEYDEQTHPDAKYRVKFQVVGRAPLNGQLRVAK